MATIIGKDNNILRKTAKEVPLGEIKSERIKRIITSMKKALSSQDDGVAIAAPQIAESLRIFVVSGRIFEIMAEEEDMPIEMETVTYPDLVFINPKITKTSRKRKLMEEGCLSVRYLYGMVSRSEKVTLEAYDEHGKKFTRGAGGLLAQVFQHETDHLNGILFTDKAKDVRNVPPDIKKI